MLSTALFSLSKVNVLSKTGKRDALNFPNTRPDGVQSCPQAFDDDRHCIGQCVSVFARYHKALVERDLLEFGI